MNDLFDTGLSKKQQLYRWMLRNNKYIPTHKIIKWGVDNFCTDAGRLARKLAEEGEIKRLTEQEKICMGFKTIQGVYEVL